MAKVVDKVKGWRLRSVAIVIGIIFWLFAVASIIYFLVIFLIDLSALVTKKYVWPLATDEDETLDQIKRNMHDTLMALCIMGATQYRSLLVRSLEFDLRFLDSEEYESTMNPTTEEDYQNNEGRRDKRQQSTTTRAAGSTTKAGATEAGSNDDQGVTLDDSEVCPPLVAAEMKKLKRKLHKTRYFHLTEEQFDIIMIIMDIFMLMVNVVLCVACYMLMTGIKRKDPSYALPWIAAAGAAVIANTAYWVARTAMERQEGTYSTGYIVGICIIFIIVLALVFFMVYVVATYFYYCFLLEMNPDSPMFARKRTKDRRKMKRLVEN